MLECFDELALEVCACNRGSPIYKFAIGYAEVGRCYGLLWHSYNTMLVVAEPPWYRKHTNSNEKDKRSQKTHKKQNHPRSPMQKHKNFVLYGRNAAKKSKRTYKKRKESHTKQKERKKRKVIEGRSGRPAAARSACSPPLNA